MATVRKAVIPAAGLGTRMLPASKSVPKEMLTVVDKPAIQYVIEEAVAAGIEDVLIITSPSKRAVEDHFDASFELETLLEQKGKTDGLDAVRAITDLATFHFTRQGQPLGLGHAVSMAQRHVGDEPFVVMLPDELMVDGGAAVGALIALHEETGQSAVTLRRVPMEEISSYGCAEVEPLEDPAQVRIPDIVEKPAVADAPSDLAVVGRYLFTPEIFTHIAATKPGVGGEIQVTDAMDALAKGSGLYGAISSVSSYDVGKKEDYLRAVVELALDHPELGDGFAETLRSIVADRGLG